GAVDTGAYPYTGFAYTIQRDGQTLVALYIGTRLVGFVPQEDAGTYTASSAGQSYKVQVEPRPLPPTADVHLTVGGEVVGSTSGASVPVIIAGGDGPVSVGSIDAANYPYNGFAYTIERDGQALVSVYVGEKLVGFMPKDDAATFQATSGDQTYPVGVVPPPLSPSSDVELRYNGAVLDHTSSTSVPIIIEGASGPVTAGCINAVDYRFTGTQYTIEREGQTLVSVYVGQKL
ncbi:hypothetical protein H632_c4654p0, partial [Helicosporidium sp. ATCC 50920]